MSFVLLLDFHAHAAPFLFLFLFAAPFLFLFSCSFFFNLDNRHATGNVEVSWNGGRVGDNAIYRGSAVNIVGSTSRFSFEHVVFEGNRQTDNVTLDRYDEYAHSGAALASGPSTVVDLSFANCSFLGNAARKYAGAVYLGAKTKSAVFDSCIFQGNTALLGGAAVYALDGTSMSITNSTFHSNTAGIDSKGGAVFVSGATIKATFERVTFDGNRAQHGDEIYVAGNVAASAIRLIDARVNMTDRERVGTNGGVVPSGFVSEAGNAYATCSSDPNVCGDLSKRCLDRRAQDHGAGPARYVVSNLGPTRSSTSTGVRTCVVDGKETICIMPLTQDDWVCKPTGSGDAHQAYCNGFKSSEVSTFAGSYSKFGDCKYATSHETGGVIKNQIKCNRALPFAVALRHDGSITAEDFFTQHISSGVLVDQGDTTTPTGTLSRKFSAESFDTVAIGCFNEKMELKSGTLHTQKASEWQALPFIAGGWTSSNFREESKQYDVFGFSEYKTGA